MIYGATFRKMMNLFPVLNTEYSGNKFSQLSRKELNSIAHELYLDGAWGDRGNYTHMNNKALANNCYRCIASI